MSRTLTPGFISEINSLNSGDTVLILLTLDHPSILPIRVVNNLEDVNSNGESFTAYGFSIILNEDVAGDKLPTLQLAIDNVDRSLMDEIRALPSPMTVTAQIVLASDPNTIEITFSNMTLRNVSYNAETITGTLTINENLNLRYPSGRVNATTYKGLF